jgi:hypothetical protein
MVKEEAMNRAIASGHEGIGEAADVESPDALFAIVSASEEFNTCVRVVGVEVVNLAK